MAKYNLESYTSADGLGFPLNFRRGNPNPLDNSSVWKSLSDAQTYAATDPVAYVGQVLTVVNTAENGSQSVTAYTIQDTNGTLKEIGSVPVGDDKTITVVNGKIQLLATDSTVDGSVNTGAQLTLQSDGTLRWVKPDTSTAEGQAAAIADLQGRTTVLETVVGNSETGLVKDVADNTSAIETLNGADTIEGSVAKSIKDSLNDFATKISDDGTINTFKELVDYAATHSSEYTELAGEVTNNKTAIEVLNGDSTTTGSVAKTVADAIAAENLSQYAKADDVATISDKVTALETVGAEKNVINSVDTTQFTVDANRNLTLNDIAISKVTGLETALAGKVDKETGKSLISDTLISKLEDIETGAQVNIIETVKVGGTELSVTDKAVDIPVANSTTLGVIKSSSDENTISISEEGTATVNSLNISKLTQGEGDELILNGGSSSN